MYYVYIIKNRRGICKIGMAENVENRIKGLQTGHPFKLVLVKSFGFASRSHARYVEHSLHLLYKAYKLKGEWFKPTILPAFLKHLELAGSIELLVRQERMPTIQNKPKKRKLGKGEFVIPNPGTKDDVVVNKASNWS